MRPLQTRVCRPDMARTETPKHAEEIIQPSMLIILALQHNQ